MAIGTINDETQYARRVIVLRGRFRINGTTTPDGIRDGKGGIVLSVARDSQGLFTVTLKPGFPIPKQETFTAVTLEQAAAPTNHSDAKFVRDSLNTTNRTFQVITQRMGTPAVNDPDDNDVVNFCIVGPAVDAFKDPA